MLFVNPVPNHMAKMLYVMGATWHTKCMFDISSNHVSFAKILNQHKIETYAVDIFGSGPDPKPHIVGNLYEKTLRYLSDIIYKYQIDSIMGYSAGCNLVADLTKQHKFRKIIFLDHKARVDLDKTFIGDKYLIDKQAVNKALEKNKVDIDETMRQDHISALCNGPILDTASYPITGQHPRTIDQPDFINWMLSQQNIKIFFTKHSTEQIRELFKCRSVYWDHTSHWILLEPHREQLAKEIVEFLCHE